jgi:hypothetical protein
MQRYSILHLKINNPVSCDLNSPGLLFKLVNTEILKAGRPEMITVLDDFFPIFVDLMKRKKIGEYNCVNPGTITHYEILTEYKRIIQPEYSFHVMEESSDDQCIDISKVLKRYPYIPNIKLSIKIVLTKIKKNKTQQ